MRSAHRIPTTQDGKGHATFPLSPNICTQLADSCGSELGHTHTQSSHAQMSPSRSCCVSGLVPALFGGTEAALWLCLHISCSEVVLCCCLWQPLSSSDLYKAHVVRLCYFFIVWNMLIQQDGKSSCISKVKNNRHESLRKGSKAFSHKSSLCSNT